jgi:hypothetical protein
MLALDLVLGAGGLQWEPYFLQAPVFPVSNKDPTESHGIVTVLTSTLHSVWYTAGA